MRIRHAQVRRRRLAARRLIAHLAQPYAVYHAGARQNPRCAASLGPSRRAPSACGDGRFAPEQIKTPETVLRVTQDREPGRPAMSGVGWYRAASMRRTTFLLMGIPKARVICCAIRGHPQIGFRCFMSTTAAMTSGLGPLGPGFAGFLDEKSRRYFGCVSARWRRNSVDG